MCKWRPAGFLQEVQKKTEKKEKKKRPVTFNQVYSRKLNNGAGAGSTIIKK